MQSPGADIQLVSGEAVHLEVRLARAGSRVLALMLDLLLQFGLWLVLMFFSQLLLIGIRPDAALVNAVMILVLVVTVVGYPTVLLAVMRGRTPGKAAMGLRVVRDDGGPISWRHSFTRALVGATLEWPGLLLPISWLASLGTLLASPQAKRLADLTAGTIVIHERTPETWGWIPTTPPSLAEWAGTLDLTGLDDNLALSARHFIARSRVIREPELTRLGDTLRHAIEACTTPAPPPNTPGWAYLSAVVGERHRRAAERLARNRASHAALWPELYPKSAKPAVADYASNSARPQ